MPIRGTDWDILDPRRIRRPGERHIQWRVSLRTKMRFTDLLHELVELELEPATWEREQRMEALRDEIRALPGYPRRYDPERDVIIPTTTSEVR